jgi:MOSC domain-containing protein YiiM
MEEQIADVNNTAHVDRFDARLLSVNVGEIEQVNVGAPGSELQVESAIRKRAVSTVNDAVPVQVGRLGVAGDEHADLSVHGGIDKAVYFYPVEHYEWWQQRRIEGLAGSGHVVGLRCARRKPDHTGRF